MRTKNFGERVERPMCSLCAALFSRVACVLCMGNDDAVTHLCRKRIQQAKNNGNWLLCIEQHVHGEMERVFALRHCCIPVHHSHIMVCSNSEQFMVHAFTSEYHGYKIAILCGNFGKFTTVSVHRSEAINILRERQSERKKM